MLCEQTDLHHALNGPHPWVGATLVGHASGEYAAMHQHRDAVGKTVARAIDCKRKDV